MIILPRTYATVPILLLLNVSTYISIRHEINKNCNWLINSNYTIISSPAYISKNEPAYVGDEAAGLNAP